MTPIYPVLPEWRRVTRKVGYGNELMALDAWDYYYASSQVILNFEGLNGTTTFTNSATGSRTISRVGTKLIISTDDKKYGSSSLYCPSDTTTSDYLSVTAAGSDYTIEAWVKLPIAGLKPYCGTDLNNIAFSTRWSSGSTDMFLTSTEIGGTPSSTNLIDSLIPANQWQHYSFQVNTGGTYTNMVLCHIDGVLIKLLQGGASPSTAKIAKGFYGYIDSFRTTGSSRIASERFLPPGSSSATTGTSTSFDPFYQANKLLCHFSQDLTDTSGWSNSLTNNGASISTSEFKFSNGSLNATSGYVTVDSTDAISSRLFINNGFQLTETHVTTDVFVNHFNYTIECWVKVNASNMQAAVFTASSNNNRDVVAFGIYTPTSTRTIIGTAQCPQNINAAILSNINIPSNTWTHVVWCRKDSVLKMYINGVLCYDAAADHGSYYLTSIGGQRNYNNTATVNLLGGYINDLRVTPGVARYSGLALTVPTASFTNCPYTYTKPVFIADSYPPSQAVLPGGGTGCDPYYSKVLARVNFDGSNGSTTVTDLSNYSRSITNNRGTISTAKSRFGGSSIYYDGSGNTSGIPATVINNVFSGNSLNQQFSRPYGLSDQLGTVKAYWSVEWWTNIDDNNQNMCFVNNGTAYYSGSGFAVYLNAGYQITLYAESFAASANVGSGIKLNWCFWHLYSTQTQTVLRVRAQDGTVLATLTNSRAIHMSNNLYVGSLPDGQTTVVGYIDDLRVTYNAFRVHSLSPTSAFPTY